MVSFGRLFSSCCEHCSNSAHAHTSRITSYRPRSLIEHRKPPAKPPICPNANPLPCYSHVHEKKTHSYARQRLLGVSGMMVALVFLSWRGLPARGFWIVRPLADSRRTCALVRMPQNYGLAAGAAFDPMGRMPVPLFHGLAARATWPGGEGIGT